MSVKVKIAGIPYTIEIFDNENKCCCNLVERSYLNQLIRVLKSSPERELRMTLYNILYIIVIEYNIRELMDDNEDPLQIPIKQLALGLAEVLESIGITKIV